VKKVAFEKSRRKIITTSWGLRCLSGEINIDAGKSLCLKFSTSVSRKNTLTDKVIDKTMSRN